MVLTLLAAILTLAGCAKFPTGAGGATTKRLIFTMTMNGPLNPSYVYIVALNPSVELNPTSQGPIPVVAPPWGNGFVAGGCTYFVQWTPNQSPTYTINQFTDPTLNNFLPVGAPINYVDVQPGGTTLQFTVSLSQLAPGGSVDLANQYQSIQVNFLTMDRVPHGSQVVPKAWDALGNSQSGLGINEYITIPLRTDNTYDNNFYNGLEPAGDVVNSSDPALDIVNFSVQVTG